MLNNKRVLVAEDNKMNRLISEKMLKNLGFTDITFAENGLEAYEKARKNHYDLVLMDIQMPVMNGLESTIKIFNYYSKNKESKPPIVGALTANTMASEMMEYLQSGISFVLSKPFSQEALEKKISLLLRTPDLKQA